jgi:hypothetical protein
MEGRVIFQTAGRCASLLSAEEVYDLKRLQAIGRAVDVCQRCGSCNKYCLRYSDGNARGSSIVLMLIL